MFSTVQRRGARKCLVVNLPVLRRPFAVNEHYRIIDLVCMRGFKSTGLSRGWFRSIDLWVMGPARFRCATLLATTTPDGTRTHNPWLRRPVPYPLGHWGSAAAAATQTRSTGLHNSGSPSDYVETQNSPWVHIRC